MARFNAFRDGRVHVKAEKCKTCIFRAGNPMRLNAGRVADMVAASQRSDSAVICHDTLGTKENAVCRGFYDSYDTTPIRLARLFPENFLREVG